MSAELVAFIKDWLRTVPAPTAILLLALGDSPAVLDTVEPAQGPYEPGDVAERLERGARVDADSGGGGIYAVVVRQGAGVLARHRFRVEPAMGLDGTNQRPVDGSAEGALRWGMTNVAELARTYLRATDGALRFLGEQLAARTKDLAQEREAHLEACQLIQQLCDRKAQRELEADGARRKEERLDRGMGTLIDVGKVVAARISGADPASRLLRRLPREHFRALVESLDDAGRDDVSELMDLAAAGKEGLEGLRGLTRPSGADKPQGGGPQPGGNGGTP